MSSSVERTRQLLQKVQHVHHEVRTLPCLVFDRERSCQLLPLGHTDCTTQLIRQSQVRERAIGNLHSKLLGTPRLVTVADLPADEVATALLHALDAR